MYECRSSPPLCVLPRPRRGTRCPLTPPPGRDTITFPSHCRPPSRSRCGSAAGVASPASAPSSTDTGNGCTLGMSTAFLLLLIPLLFADALLLRGSGAVTSMGVRASADAAGDGAAQGSTQSLDLPARIDEALVALELCICLAPWSCLLPLPFVAAGAGALNLKRALNRGVMGVTGSSSVSPPQCPLPSLRGHLRVASSLALSSRREPEYVNNDDVEPRPWPWGDDWDDAELGFDEARKTSEAGECKAGPDGDAEATDGEGVHEGAVENVVSMGCMKTSDEGGEQSTNGNGYEDGDDKEGVVDGRGRKGEMLRRVTMAQGMRLGC
ncbi:hypothetical protein C8F04DRAFT_1403157 [Mycena alexandri]|uniref:Uncharacterized protein n=1 Tax=Mycena alexandri TaxID=1745969 RepID=A0AAD6S4N1_9AGAR|nr:hypothetical protein C8F04DRAFT_1403157 [Mycena alexandri]